ncbi:hypothetical protein ABL840_06075 [Variovorax sp. NFACC27]|uniref:DUF7003 family protein n=1 Tax=unclassified Variovorax TaxID=663243 RepID=UPI000895C2C4|nr:hypothetical protein SAMN03159371_00345 [Variovorax sp. NFACC28]SEF63453.1 hypothetical protein SAMN03159365_00473 [Variovorax sp. NFACC29]SFB73550.1 hypothetical protein SAMN03159379_00472 [Variovorax sp. NFACC26]SFG55764.1 hypothetical protein SAMN03159447_03833 [Variovorax sp. NFACC27]
MLNWREADILSILDQSCENYVFPMLDNGYVYLGATRMSLYRSLEDWAMVIEVFGFSPRSGLPDTHVHTFASRLHDRNPETSYVSRAAYDNYLARNPHNESRFIYPIEEGGWQDAENLEWVAVSGGHELILRGQSIPTPTPADCSSHQIVPLDRNRLHTFELCRILAATHRDNVLATATERRANVRPEMMQILQLEEWHHPNVVDEQCRPSNSATFQQLAKVLTTGDASHYRAELDPNTHWINWPEGGTL